jgi:hypothetical protein
VVPSPGARAPRGPVAHLIEDDSNPRVALIDLTIQGSDWLWAVFAVMLASACGMSASSIAGDLI